MIPVNMFIVSFVAMWWCLMKNIKGKDDKIFGTATFSFANQNIGGVYDYGISTNNNSLSYYHNK